MLETARFAIEAAELAELVRLATVSRGYRMIREVRERAGRPNWPARHTSNKVNRQSSNCKVEIHNIVYEEKKKKSLLENHLFTKRPIVNCWNKRRFLLQVEIMPLFILFSLFSMPKQKQYHIKDKSPTYASADMIVGCHIDGIDRPSRRPLRKDHFPAHIIKVQLSSPLYI